MTNDENYPLPGEDVVIQTAVESAYLPEYEREERREIVGELVHELVEKGQIDLIEREQLLNLYDENMRIARGETQKQPSKVTASVDANKISWIEGVQQTEVEAEQVEAETLSYKFVDLTGMNSATHKCMELLAMQTKGSEQLLPKLLTTLKEVALPRLYHDIKTGGSLRPMTKTGNNDRADTEYPAYKIGVHGTQNRAIILLLEDGGEGPTLALAALYDHDDEAMIYHALY